jgi:peptidoglycan/LPS O-acetylase OafA/YrhL
VSHAWPVGGYGKDPKIGDMSVGTWAVAGFFVISGYLIASSRSHSSIMPFLWRRFLRIFPGLWVCLLFTVAVFVPIAEAREGHEMFVPISDRVSYVVSNGLLVPDHFSVDGTLATVPFAHTWNGSLWTLLYEVGCYLLIAALLSIVLVRRLPSLIAGAFALCSILAIVDQKVRPLPSHRLGTLVGLATFFLAGSVLYLYGRRIPHHWTLGVAAIGTLIGLAYAHEASVAAAIPLAYTCMWLGIVLPFQRIGRVNDISYGVYIYAFPVQQILAVYLASKVGIGGFIALSIALTVPFAAASWFIVDHPALQFKRLRRRPAMTPAVDTAVRSD